MKTVLMILFFFGGLAIQQVDAQKCSMPCTPACCLKSCALFPNGTSVSIKNDEKIDATLASFLFIDCPSTCQQQSEAGMYVRSPAETSALVKCGPSPKCETSSSTFLVSNTTFPAPVKEKG